MKINITVKKLGSITFLLFLCSYRTFQTIPCSIRIPAYEIICEIDGIPDGTSFFLVKNGGVDTVASAKVVHGSFKFEGALQHEGELHFIKLDTTFMKLAKGNKSYVRLLLDHSKIRISGSLERWPETKIVGSDATESFEMLYSEVQKRRDSVKKKCDEISMKYIDPEKKREIDREVTDYYRKLFSFLNENKNSLATPLFVYNFAPDSLEYIMSLYNNFPEKIKNGYYARQLIEKRVPQIKARSLVTLNNRMPDLNSLFDTNGNRVSILAAAKKSKLTLIDFWASWCKPCRAQTPRLTAIYNEFRGKGFSIIGISQDIKKDSWIKAIKDDGVSWLNLVDSSNNVSEIFGLEGIPAFLLIDQNGSMIAFSAISSVKNFGPSLRMDELHNTINTLLNQLPNN